MDADLETREDPAAFVKRLCEATNAHDVEAVVACFAPDYRNETPVHPERGFEGAEQVRRNWIQIFGAIPDLRTEVTRVSVDGDTVWSEWEHQGTRGDGSRHLMRGVVIFGVRDARAQWARFYLEPVSDGGLGVNQAVRDQVVRDGPR
jgi:ketosteroid isomerase-like protein